MGGHNLLPKHLELGKSRAHLASNSCANKETRQALLWGPRCAGSDFWRAVTAGVKPGPVVLTCEVSGSAQTGSARSGKSGATPGCAL
eukprot:scaffold22369_cov22-Tisochrysis_lutea.AAC.1